ncbi:Extracellular serine ase [Chlorella sorokiniana]|uniref:Extracellular serine ase n=1 Tax=Chlorella sorokiniana TaxID=3076 RepID=A0A2P6TH75_CHLSO|nr:Extracellular serine ase [Chlorella sorokiniana]|eukprot:PRW33645.1 Extracellular serine ase [Chlorella sorokiniana]
MAAARVGRRAAPPRPTLLVGDLDACHAAFGRLQDRVLQLSLAQQAAVADTDSSADANAWRDLVPLCRALRETLTSLRELSHFTREVYEVAADVCLRAGDYPEALKALQQLVHLIYPALAAQEAALAAAEAAAAAAAPAGRAEEPAGPRAATAKKQSAAAVGVASSSSSSGGSSGSRARAAAAALPLSWDDDSDAAEEDWAALAGGVTALDDAAVGAALQQRRFQRWPEAAGALAAYFSCVQGPREGRLDTLATLRRLPRPLLATSEVQAALALAGSLAAGDYVQLFRLRAAAPPLVRLVAGAAAGAARERALAAMATAYRNIAAAAVCRALALSMHGLLACLKALADRGQAAAQKALGGLQMEERPEAADLVFKG